MKLELLKKMGKLLPGETFTDTNEDRAKKLIEDGTAKEVSELKPEEMKRVLVRNEDGTYETPLVPIEKGDEAKAATSTAAVQLTVKELSEKFDAATTKEELELMLPAGEDRKGVKDAYDKKLKSFG